MPHGKHGDGFAIEAIQSDVAAVSKIDQPFRDRSTYARSVSQDFDSASASLDGALRRFDVLRRDKAIGSSNVSERPQGPDQS